MDSSPHSTNPASQYHVRPATAEDIPVLVGFILAELLLNYVEEQARAAGAVELRLYAHQENLRALRSYKKAGYGRLPYVILWKSLR